MSELSSTLVDASPALARASALELPRFGVVLAGYQFVLPEQAVCDFVLRAQLFSLPMAPGRVVGLVHSRGFGIPVFDAGRTVRERVSMKLDEPLLIIGQGSQAGALVVDQAPALLGKLSEQLSFDQLSPSERASSPTSSDHPVFTGLETSAYRGKLADISDASNNAAQSLWWSLPFENLFVRLSQLKGQ
jgi:chemotaxis signal transduction protein